MRTSTWPAAGCGVGTCLSFRTSGPPNSPTRIAFIFGLQRCYCRLAAYHIADAQRLGAPKQNPAAHVRFGSESGISRSLTEVHQCPLYPRRQTPDLRRPALCNIAHVLFFARGKALFDRFTFAPTE